MIKRYLTQQAGCFLVCLLLAGCGGEPYAYQPDNELKPGPGLFSGEDGEFTLIGTPIEGKDPEPEPTSAEPIQ